MTHNLLNTLSMPKYARLLPRIFPGCDLLEIRSDRGDLVWSWPEQQAESDVTASVVAWADFGGNIGRRPMPDGRIIYQRWEYVDRSQVLFHHLWTSNPDGTGQMVFFGNMHGGWAYLDAKPIPSPETTRDPRVVMIHSPGHGRTEHLGYIEIIDRSQGPDSRANVKRITPNPDWRDPYPLPLVTKSPEKNQPFFICFRVSFGL